MQAFGVTFFRADIEKMIPADLKTLSPEAIYLELERLVAEMPDLLHGPVTAERNLWLGDAAALIKMIGDTTETVKFNVASENLHGATREGNAHTIIAVVNRALSQARRDVPAFQGALLEAGRSYDAFAAVGKVLRVAKLGAYAQRWPMAAFPPANL